MMVILIALGTYNGLYYYENIDSENGFPVYNRINIQDIGISYEGVAALSLADIDHDDLDLFLGGEESLTYFKNISKNNSNLVLFAQQQSSLIGVEPLGLLASPTFIDFDRDNDKDLVIGDLDRIKFYENISSQSSSELIFSLHSEYGDTGNTWPSPSFADLNNDGLSNLFVTDSYGRITEYENVSSQTAIVESLSPAGTYQVGDEIRFSINYNEDVYVLDGNPLVRLNLGSFANPRSANYISGSGSRQLEFSYTVQNGDQVKSLDLLSLT